MTHHHIISRGLTLGLMLLTIATALNAQAAVDSVRIVPRFNVGDSRTFHVTTVNRLEGAYTETVSANHRFTVLSADEDHYGILFITDSVQREIPEGVPESQAYQFMDFFCNTGYKFFINRHTLAVDSVSGNEIKEPLRNYLTKFYTMFNDGRMSPDQLQQYLDEQLTDAFLSEQATRLMEIMVSTFTDQYGRTLPLGEAQWTEVEGELEEVLLEPDDADNATDEGLPDFELKYIHQATTSRGEDGSIQYDETITMDVPAELGDPVWIERTQASFDPQGWPVEIVFNSKIAEMIQEIHWQVLP